jgi:murein DD-endopeptidase MepM/ murein hydrolase activator NlpD
VLDRVGWNAIGGYRFWLFDQYGNSFYHAHLSAFSPLAVDGARVRRGDVIGFVGHTGDAQFTPPHLHFEVHPGNADATNPYPLLNAWQRGIAVAIGLVTSGTERVAPLALLGFSDISANSGLQESVLDTVPDTRERSIEQETAPRPTDESLTGAIEGPATSPAAR